MADGGSLLLPLRIFVEDPFPSTIPQSVDQRFSTKLSELLPDFVVEDHPVFVAFAKAYLEWTEQFGNPRAEAVRISSFYDLDNSIDSFLTYFKNTYLYDFPESLANGVDEKTLIKNINKYYGAKGSERALELLFRVLFNQNASVEYPREQVIRLSESDYSVRNVIKTTRVNGRDLTFYKGGLITELDPKNNTTILGKAEIDEITLHNQEAIDYCLITVKNVSGTFTPNQDVIISKGSRENLRERIFDTIQEVNLATVNGVTQDGLGYNIDDSIVVKDLQNKIIGSTRIRQVSGTGQVTSIDKFRSGRIFNPAETYVIEVQTAGGSGAQFDIFGGKAISELGQLFESERSLISSSSRIQNNFSYQEFSYRVKSGVGLKEYANIIKKIFHPAGSMLLGAYEFFENTSMIGMTFSSSAADVRPRLVPRIGNYAPFKIGETADLRGDTYGNDFLGYTFGDFYPLGYDGLTAAPGGSFDPATGAAITHDAFRPFGFPDIPRAQLGSLYYDNSDDLSPSPLFLFNGFSGVTLAGYTTSTRPQTVMTLTDGSTFEFYNVFRHPKSLFNVVTDQEAKRLNSSYRFIAGHTGPSGASAIKRSFNKVEIFAVDVKGSYSANDIFEQQIPFYGTVRGKLTKSFETVTASKAPGGAKFISKKSSDFDTSDTNTDFINDFGNTSRTLATPGSNVAKFTFIMENGNFTNQEYNGRQIPIVKKDGTASFLLGLGEGTGTVVKIISEQGDTGNLQFGDVRIGDFFDNLFSPSPGTDTAN